MGIIEKSGTWYSYKSQRLGQGKNQAKDFLEGNPLVLKNIESEVVKKAELVA
jgi:recombination protein RecA